MLRCWPLVLVFAVACGGEDGKSDTDDVTGVDPDPTETTEPTGPTGTTDTGPTDTAPDCDATVVSVDPANNSEAQADAVVNVIFSEAIVASDPLSISLTEVGGAAVSGTVDLAGDGLSATFTPDATLAYDTEYDVAIDVCQSSIAGGFRTVPAPIDGAMLEGRTYGLLYDDVVFTEPGNTALLVLDIDYILVQVDTVDLLAETIESVATTGLIDGAGVVQPDCAAAVQAPTSDFSINPRFSVGPADLSYPYNGGTITIEDFLLEAEFNADGTAITDVYVSGLVDPSQILDGISCALAAPLVSGSCVPCPSGLGDCLVIEAEAPEALWLDTVDVVGTCGL